jgi:hypothetical protein
VLRDIARLLQDTVGDNGIAFRYGGEEFLIILPDTSETDARKLAELLLQSVLDHRIFYESHDIGQVSISIGLATWPQHAGGKSDPGSGPCAIWRKNRGAARLWSPATQTHHRRTFPPDMTAARRARSHFVTVSLAHNLPASDRPPPAASRAYCRRTNPLPAPGSNGIPCALRRRRLFSSHSPGTRIGSSWLCGDCFTHSTKPAFVAAYPARQTCPGSNNGGHTVENSIDAGLESALMGGLSAG